MDNQNCQNIKISQLPEQTTLLLDDEFPFIRKQGNEYVNYKVKKYALTPSIPNASSTVSGIIKLAGDLGGTSSSPTVPGLALKANINSPSFTGTPTAITPSVTDNSTKLATTAFVHSFVPIASSTSAGKVKIGSGISITSDGTISASSVSSLPNGVLINGVCHIYQTTKPTTRPNGTALAVGDIWYDTTITNKSKILATWNGIYWVGDLFYLISPSISITPTLNSGLGITNFPFDTTRLLLESWGFVFRQEPGTFNSTNFWTIQLTFRYAGNNNYNVPAVSSIKIDTAVTAASTIYKSNPINSVISLTSGYRSVQVNATRTGTASPSINEGYFWVKCRGVL